MHEKKIFFVFPVTAIPAVTQSVSVGKNIGDRCLFHLFVHFGSARKGEIACIDARNYDRHVMLATGRVSVIAALLRKFDAGSLKVLMHATSFFGPWRVVMLVAGL